MAPFSRAARLYPVNGSTKGSWPSLRGMGGKKNILFVPDPSSIIETCPSEVHRHWLQLPGCGHSDI